MIVDGYDGEGDFVYRGEGGGDIPHDVTRVRIHPSVKVIQDYAFRRCTQLRTVAGGKGPFRECTPIREISIPPAVKALRTMHSTSACS
jgi:hypothetical protein